MRNLLALSLLVSLNVSAQGVDNTQRGEVWSTASAFNTAVATKTFGTYLTPFAVNSPWNSRPVNPVLGTSVVVMPSAHVPNKYDPQITSRQISTGFFVATASDPAVTVYPRSSQGITNTDVGGVVASVTIPRWPAGVVPAAGPDGHADIYDEVTGRIYSFWLLKETASGWTAENYSWTHIKGTGWGDPAHRKQGARATGAPTIAGLIRKHEINDGEPVYAHALSMTLAHNSLSKTIGYVYPATDTDHDLGTNSGTVSAGTRLMLPADFQLSSSATADLQKVVETLKQYGAYVVDRNTETPYNMHVEQGADLNLGSSPAADLEKIRLALRPLISAEKWVDGNGVQTADALKPAANLNVLSMRGPWNRLYGGAPEGNVNGVYNSELQALELPAPNPGHPITTENKHITGIKPPTWAQLLPGDRVRFWVYATGNGSVTMEIGSSTGAWINTGAIGSNQYYDFVWPAGAYYYLGVYQGSAGGPTLTQATLTKLP
jgi:hypothetical protein